MDHLSELKLDLILEVRRGRVEQVRELITSYGLPQLDPWLKGYVLLCDSIKYKHTEVTKLLLKSGCKVNNKIKRCCDTALHLAVRNGKIEIVSMLLQRDARVNARNKMGSRPLHEAIRCNEIEVTQLLLNYNADVNATDKEYQSPLQIATKCGHVKVVKLLLDHGANVDGKIEGSKTVLHFAAQRGNLEIVEVLLQHGANINNKDYEGKTPIFYAVENSDIKMTELLINNAANIKDNIGLLHIAVTNGCSEIVEALLQHGANINAKDHVGKKPIFYSVENSDIKMTELLINNAANITDNIGLLHIAITNGCSEIVEALLQHGADINAEDHVGKTPIFYAVKNNHLQIIELLLTNGVSVNDMPDLLNIAVQKRCNKIIEFVLQHGADINTKDYGGKTPIFNAVENSDIEMTELLIANAANIKDNIGLLHIAVTNAYIELVKALLQHGADINAQDHIGKTPIFYAVENTNLQIFELLLTNGASINGMPDLLNIAVQKKCNKIIELLLQRGVDINAKDDAGKTAIFYAVQNMDLEIINLLLTYKPLLKGQPELLNIAVKKRRRKIVEVLLQHGADINDSDKDGVTALHCITLIFPDNEDYSMNSRREIAQLLLTKGANVNAKLTDGMTALHIATEANDLEVTEVLLKYGAKVDSVSESGITPLHIAAYKDTSHMTKILLEFGADVDVRDKYGRTALHIACRERRPEIVKFLLEYGSDINIVSNDDCTPLEYALNKELFHNKADERYSDEDLDDPTSRSKFLDFDILEYFLEHVLKMLSAELYVGEPNLLSIDRETNTCFQSFYVEEIEIMKSEKIGESNVSFYDFLKKNINQLAIYVRNENIVNVLNSYGYKIKFRHYASMINNSFKKAMKRKKLLEQCNTLIHSLNIFPELPYNCTENIFSYLSNDDLKTLVDICM